MNYITKEGLEKLKNKLKNLEKIERTKITQQISDARDKGDLSENAEYDAAKEAQIFLEIKISKIKNQIINSKIINPNMLKVNKIGILNKVKLKNLKNNNLIEYTLVPETEINLKLGKISINSPIAQALVGKIIGDIVNVKLPTGDTIKFEVLNIKI